MDVNFTLPLSVPRGTAFQVRVAVRHATAGEDVTVELTEPSGPTPRWSGGKQTRTATTAAPSATDGSADFVFDVTLGGPGTAQLSAVATDTAGGFDTHAEHTEVT